MFRKPVHFLSSITTTMATAILLVCIVEYGFAGTLTTYSFIPNFIMYLPDNPEIAVFEDIKEFYAIGCLELRNLWKDSRRIEVNINQWKAILHRSPIVAHVHCNHNTRVYAPKGEPGALIFTHTDGKVYRHYIA